jgi:hypothetical protein
MRTVKILGALFMGAILTGQGFIAGRIDPNGNYSHLLQRLIVKFKEPHSVGMVGEVCNLSATTGQQTRIPGRLRAGNQRDTRVDGRQFLSLWFEKTDA